MSFIRETCPSKKEKNKKQEETAGNARSRLHKSSQIVGNRPVFSPHFQNITTLPCQWKTDRYHPASEFRYSRPGSDRRWQAARYWASAGYAQYAVFNCLQNRLIAVNRHDILQKLQDRREHGDIAVCCQQHGKTAPGRAHRHDCQKVLLPEIAVSATPRTLRPEYSTARRQPPGRRP